MTTTATSGYWTVLRTPRVPSLLAAGALGRLPGGILPFALVVAFARQDGFAIAGAAAALFPASPTAQEWCSAGEHQTCHGGGDGRHPQEVEVEPARRTRTRTYRRPTPPPPSGGRADGGRAP